MSDSEAPEVIGRFNDDDGGEALGVWGDREYLYVADNLGVEVLDVKDPTSTKVISCRALKGRTYYQLVSEPKDDTA